MCPPASIWSTGGRRRAPSRAQVALLGPLIGHSARPGHRSRPRSPRPERLKVPGRSVGSVAKGAPGCRSRGPSGQGAWPGWTQPRLGRRVPAPPPRDPPGSKPPGEQATPRAPHAPRRGRRRSAGSPRTTAAAALPRQVPAPASRPGRPPVPGVDPAGPPGVVIDVEDLAVVVPGLLPAPGSGSCPLPALLGMVGEAPLAGGASIGELGAGRGGNGDCPGPAAAPQIRAPARGGGPRGCGGGHARGLGASQETLLSAPPGISPPCLRRSGEL